MEDARNCSQWLSNCKTYGTLLLQSTGMHPSTSPESNLWGKVVFFCMVDLQGSQSTKLHLQWLDDEWRGMVHPGKHSLIVLIDIILTILASPPFHKAEHSLVSPSLLTKQTYWQRQATGLCTHSSLPSQIFPWIFKWSQPIMPFPSLHYFPVQNFSASRNHSMALWETVCFTLVLISSPNHWRSHLQKVPLCPTPLATSIATSLQSLPTLLIHQKLLSLLGLGGKLPIWHLHHTNRLGTTCYVQIPKESTCGQGQKVGGWKRVQLIAIDYHAATGTAGMGFSQTQDIVIKINILLQEIRDIKLHKQQNNTFNVHKIHPKGTGEENGLGDTHSIYNSASTHLPPNK